MSGTKIIYRNDRLSFEPMARDVERYSFAKLKSDLSSAVSVALLSLPQALAYSVVAGVPPIAGVISVVLGTFIAALLSSSSHLVIGPNNATSLLVQAAAVELSRSAGVLGDVGTVQMIGVLSLLIGLFQLLAAFFKLGRLIQFVSYSVVVGYIAGTATAIGVGQLFPLTGVICPSGVETLYQKARFWLFHLHQAHIPTVAVGFSSFALCMLLRKCRVRVPVMLTMLVIMTSVVTFFGIAASVDEHGYSLALLNCGDLRSAVIAFDAPLFDVKLLNALFPVAFAIALIGMMEANAIAKSVAVTTGQRLSANQEVLALGSANFFLSFLGALPCSGSASRTAVNVESGARTRFSAIAGALLVAIFAFCLSGLIQYIPRASLAALLMATAIKLLDIRQIQFCCSTTKSDAFVLVATFLFCIFFSLPLALYMGVFLSIILYLRKAAIPHVSEYIYEESIKKFRPATEKERKVSRSIRVINVEGELFFGAVDLFQHTLRAMAKDDRGTKVIILRLKHVHDLDVTAALALKQLKDYLHRHDQHFIVCSVPQSIFAFLERSRITSYLGKENIIVADDHSPHSDLSKAFARARDILQGSSANIAHEMGALPIVQSNFVTISVKASCASVEDPT